MAYSYVRYTGNGSTTNFAFSFPYLSRDHVKVRVNDVLTSFTFLNDSTVTVSPAPASGAVVEVRRETPKDTPVVNFTDGSVLLEADLDLLATYNLYVAQESDDINENALVENYQGVFNGEGKRITNVADPVNPQDVATKAYADTPLAAATAAAISAAASASQATASAATAVDRASLVTNVVNSVAPQVVSFVGTGAQTSFNLGFNPLVEENIDVYINGVWMPLGEYSLSGNNIIFATAPVLGAEIDVKAAAGVQITYTDAQQVAYTPTVGVTRSVKNKLLETVSVKDFGAVGDGVTDDTAAIQAAVNAVQAVYFPVGTYKITTQITVSKSTAFAIYGEGIGNSILLWTNATGGFSITMSNNYDSVTIDGLSLRTEYAGGGTALALTYPVSPSSIFVGARLSNIEMRGSNNTVDYWTTGLRLLNGWNAQCSGLHIQGADTVPRGMVKAISMTNCYDVVITACYGTRGEYGIWVGDGADEGFNISQCVFIDFHTGIYFNSFEAQAGTAIRDNHMNTETYGINFQAKQQCVISGNLIYKITGSTASYVGISMKYGNDCRVTDNYIRNTGLTGGEIGVLLDDTDNCIISGNHFVEFNSGSVGVQVGALSGGNLISNNLTYTAGTAVVNFGTGSLQTNYALNNFPVTVSVLSANATTPSVGNDIGGQWKTANTVATTITNFLDAYETQVISILANDSNTTIQHNSGLILKGGVNYVMSLGDIITLRRDATLWREVSRNT